MSSSLSEDTTLAGRGFDIKESIGLDCATAKDFPKLEELS